VIGHHEEKIKIKENHRDQLTLIAFYADCPHEVEMVKSGHRISLTFNISIKELSKESISPCLNPQEELTENLNEYFSKENCKIPSKYGSLKPNKFVYLLDHEYTQKGLSWDRLKNADQVRVQALREAAKAIGLEVHLVLAKVKEVWDCTMCENPLRLKKNGKPSRKRTETYIICDETTLMHWIDENGTIIDSYNGSFVNNDCICWTKATNDFKPFESEYEKWMGNYGNTMDHWYHRAAIVLWRKEDC
jgi:hypothetical protein